MQESVREALLAATPALRAFAMSLCGNVDRADDLVQETMLRAVAHVDSFEPDTNMNAWLFTILRNHFRSEYRRRRREVEDADGHFTETLKSHPEQYGCAEFREFREILDRLPADQREVLVLVGTSGFSYDEAATIIGCAVGTVKSRLHRARIRLAKLMGVDSAEDIQLGGFYLDEASVSPVVYPPEPIEESVRTDPPRWIIEVFWIAANRLKFEKFGPVHES